MVCLGSLGIITKRVGTILINIFRPSMTSCAGSDENERMAFLLQYPAAVLITMCSVTLCLFLYNRTTACGIYGLNFHFNQLIYSLLPEKYSYFYINKIQQDATVFRYLFTAKLFYMFRMSIAPIIRST